MTEKEILIKAANVIDDTAINISCTVEEERVVVRHRYSLFGFKFGKKAETQIIPVKRAYCITGATLRTMLRVTKLILQMDGVVQPKNITSDWILSLVANNVELTAQAIAAAIHNRKSEVPAKLVDEILDNIDSDDLQKVMAAVIDKLNLTSFISTIGSVRSMQMMQTETQPSPQEQVETIAPGQQLESLQSILGSATIKS